MNVSPLERRAATRLAQARERAGLSQAQVAQMLDLNSATVIAHFETGDRQMPLGVFLRLCELYGVSKTWALTGANPSFDPEPIMRAFGEHTADVQRTLDLLESLDRPRQGDGETEEPMKNKHRQQMQKRRPQEVPRPRINQYTCTTCGGVITTIDLAKGTTPFFLACRATPGCEGRMESHGYQVGDVWPPPDYEWYRPHTMPDDPAMAQHVRMGGLLIRKAHSKDES